MIHLIGIIGAIFLGVCSLPQAYASYRAGHSIGINRYFLVCWLLGEIFMTVYTLLKYGASDIPVLLNYTINLMLVTIITKYSFFPR